MKNLLKFLIIIVPLFVVSCDNKEDIVTREVISLDGNQAGRPYSPAIRVGNMLFVSGQIAIDPKTGDLVEGGIEEQTSQVLTNLESIIKAAGFSLSDVVKCNVLLDSIVYYGPMNSVYITYFTDNPPARKAYAVEALPMGAMIEIDAIAVK